VDSRQPVDRSVEVVRELLDLLVGTGIAEIEVEAGDLKVHVHRDVVLGPSTFADPHAPPVDRPAAENGHVDRGTVVTSSYVGEFHRAADGPEIGSAVAPGTRLGEIEVLGIPNAVVAPIAGILAELLVEDQSPVEYGQPLAVIRE
jgi:biotin carboxyl carrier protein